MKNLHIVIALIAITILGCVSGSVEDEWTQFKANYKKSYENAIEEEKRKSIFLENYKNIVEHNKKFINGDVSYSKDVNQFSDLTPTEFQQKYTIPVMNNTIDNFPFKRGGRAMIFTPTVNVNLPSTVDWRLSGAVTKAKSQGGCGTCVHFATIAALESHWFLRTGQLVELSEQNLVDCAPNYKCDASTFTLTFPYLWQGGVMRMSAYPYEEKLGTCRFNKANAIAKTRGYVSIKGSSEEALKNAVATVGPVAVAIHALNNLGSYRSGVYYDPTCTGGRNHAVLVVGYGTENGMDYWLVKNSWGAGFGQDGFIKMARNKNNMCDIAGDPMYPIF